MVNLDEFQGVSPNTRTVRNRKRHLENLGTIELVLPEVKTLSESHFIRQNYLQFLILLMFYSFQTRGKPLDFYIWYLITFFTEKLSLIQRKTEEATLVGVQSGKPLSQFHQWYRQKSHCTR